MANHLDFILQEIKTFEDFQKHLHYAENDVRKDYYGMIKNIMTSYYRKYSFVILAKDIREGRIMFGNDCETGKDHIDSLYAIWSSDISVFDLRNNINRGFITDNLSIFETAISTILDNVLPDDEKQALLGRRGNHISNIGVKKKWGKFFDLISENYDRDLQGDKKFLDFFAAYRNSMHSNMVFYGREDFNYFFNGIEIYFRFGKSVTQSGNFGIDWHFKLGTNLVTTFTAMVHALNYDDFISYPDIESP